MIKNKIMILLIITLLALFVSTALATTNNASIDPSAAVVAAGGAAATLQVRTNSDAAVSSLEIIGSYDLNKFTLVLTPTLTGADNVAWPVSTVRITRPSSSTFRLQAATIGGAVNFLSAGIQSVLRIEATPTAGAATGPSNIIITSAKVNNIQVTGLAGTVVTITPAATCSDGLINQDETDVDCGGGSCPACANLDSCSANTDCVSNNCVSGACAPPIITCSDGTQNGAETDVDCGGGTCPACGSSSSSSSSGGGEPSSAEQKEAFLGNMSEFYDEKDTPTGGILSLLSRIASYLRSVFG